MSAHLDAPLGQTNDLLHPNRAQGVPILDAIRGNVFESEIPKSKGTDTEDTRLTRRVSSPLGRTFMKEYLAQIFGPPDGSIPPDEVGLRETGAHLQNIVIDDEGELGTIPPPDDASSAVQLLDQSLESPRVTLSEPFSDNQDLKKVQLMSSSPAPRPPSPQPSLHGQMFTKDVSLSDARNELVPREGCDNSFFSSCASSFTSDRKIWEYMTEPRVRRLLDQCKLGTEIDKDKGAKDELATKICGLPTSKTDTTFTSYRKIFTILILMKEQDQINAFVEAKLDDDCLPLPELQNNPNQPRLPGSKPCHPCFLNWDLSTLKQFGKYQMQMCAPFFKQEIRDKKYHHYVFPQGVALPFLSAGNKLSRGASGVVVRVELPEDHGNLETCTRENDSKKRLFAIKKLRYPDTAAFQSEKNILSRHGRVAEGKKGKHLAVLSATFEVQSQYGSAFYFILPCADSTLRQFWNGHSTVIDVPKMSRWMAEQLRGLAEAVNILHNFNLFRSSSDLEPRNRAIHGDIKPDNILLFQNWHGYEGSYGVLQLADFGLTEYHLTSTVNDAKPRVLAHYYCPPEANLQWNAGQSTDIWCLGCLFLEFSVWLVSGKEGLEKFTAARRTPRLEHENFFSSVFFEISTSSVFWFDCGVDIKLNGVVIERVKEMHENEVTTMFIHNLLDLITGEMLILPDPEMRSAEQVLWKRLKMRIYWLLEKSRWVFKWSKRPKGEKKKRITSGPLVARLEVLLQSGDDSAYFETPVPYQAAQAFPQSHVHTFTTKKQFQERFRERRKQAEERRGDMNAEEATKAVAHVRTTGDYEADSLSSESNNSTATND